AAAEDDLQPAEDAGDRVPVPGIAVGVAEELSLRVPQRQLASNLQRPCVEVDHTREQLALRLLGREHPAGALQLQLAGLNGNDLLWPGRGFPGDLKQVLDLLGREAGQDEGVDVFRDDNVPLAGLGLLKAAEGGAEDDLLVLGPAEGAADGAAEAVLRGAV